MKKYIYYIIPLMIIFIWSCDNSTNPEDDGVLIPLKTGNYWNYTTILQNKPQETHFNRVISDTIINNEQWFKMTEDDSVFFFIKNKSDGLNFLSYNSENKKWNSTIVYKYPGKQGEIYTNDDGIKIEIQSISDSVSVPAGKFRCVRYKVIYSDDFSTLEYFSPNIGLIKIVAYNKEHIIEYTTILKNYSLIK